jgi:hypothetical protein
VPIQSKKVHTPIDTIEEKNGRVHKPFKKIPSSEQTVNESE